MLSELIELLMTAARVGDVGVLIEHNLDVIARADWVLDMGPGAGSEGGKIVFEGVPAKLVKHPASLTGQYLAKRVA